MSNLFMEARYAFRSLVKSPVFFITAVLTLAIGIGANTARFSVVNTVLLKPLPYDNSDRLVLFWGELVARDVNYFPESPGNLNHYRENTSLFEDIAGVSSFGQTLTTDEGDPLRVNVGGATWNFHELLGAEVLMGRNFNEQDSVFNPEEVLPNAQFPANTFLPPKSVILSYDFWQTRFGGDPNVLGKILRLNANPVEVVGIMPDDFELYVPPTANMTTDIQIWSPLRVDLANAPTNNVFLQMMGRLKPGVTLEQAQSEINNIVEGMLETNSVLKTARFRKWVAFYEQELTREASAVIWTLMGASIFVLLIACANVANLLLVRATGRSREIAIRAAIGSSRSRLIAQMFIESALLALFAALFGVLLADLGLQAILSAAPDNVARLDKIGIDFAVLGFTLLAVAFTAMLAGTAPAMLGTRMNISGQLRDRSGTAGLPSNSRFRNSLVIGEVALSFVLLIGAGLMVRSFVELNRIDPGFNPNNLLTFRINQPFQRYPTAEDRTRFDLQLQERINNLPGVENSTGAFPLPLSGQAFNGRYTTDTAAGDDTEYRQAGYRTILPGYFETLGTRLVAGRYNNEDDEVNARPNVVINNLLAEEAWPDENPIGKQLMVRLGGPQPVPVNVIGVVEHQKHFSLQEPGNPTIFMPSAYPGQFGGVGQWAVRTSVDPISVVNLIKEEIAALDAEMPMSFVQPMNNYVNDAMGPTRFALMLIGVFGLSALALAAIGLYAVLAYVVRQRRSEIGVRMSFGAQPGNVFSLFIRQGMLLASLGLVIGIVAALFLGRSLSSLLVGVTSIDPLTYGTIVFLFLFVAMTACLFPAWRATRVDPMTVLREE